MEKILKIKSLNTSFQRKDGIVKAVSNVSLELKEGKVFGLIGESGCGKSVLAHSVMRLLPSNATLSGEILYKGQDICKLSAEAVRQLRGKEIGLIAQNPAEALNPLLKIGTQLLEPMALHRGLSRKKGWGAAVDLLKALDLPNPQQKMKEYPHQLSGGMKQRILTALGISGEPSLLIADEPTKGLDVLVRRQVVEVLRRLAAFKGTTLLIITHDIQVAGHLCDELTVMYAGEIIEQGPTQQLFEDPRHSYLKGLIASLPGKGLNPIPGFSPSLMNLPQGCKFFERCPNGKASCQSTAPELKEVSPGHQVRCMSID